ncbi:MAG: carboxypeptidase regulatory-like domain-containing protein [Terracidiphilus sp.]
MVRRISQRMFIAAMAAAMALTFARAQNPSTRGAPAVQGFRVAGTVVNANTGEPVRGAAVALLTVEDSHMMASTESGDDGRFSMDSLSAGKYQLTASKRGYTTGFYNQHFEYNSAVVTGPGQDTGQLVFRLSPAAVIYGVVSGDGGDPVDGASVMLYEKPHRHVPGEKIEQLQTVQTDDTGAYEFSGLEPGDYLIAVEARPWYATTPNGPGALTQESEAEAALDVAYPVTFFDSTTDEGSAATVTMAAGGREEADISVHAVQAVRLSVPSPRGRGAAQPSLEETVFGLPAQNASFGSTESTPPDAQGNPGMTEFAGIAPGHYELTQGDPPRRVEMDAATSQLVDPSAGVPTQTVSGVVQTAPGVLLPGRGQVMLVSADGTGPTVSPAQIVGGSFKMNDVPPGSWLVEALFEDTGLQTQMPVLAVGLRGGRPVAGNRIAVDDKPLSLVVTVSAGNTRIEGFARKDGKGVAGAMVILVPKDISQIAELARRDQSDSDGSFALLNVAPGDYTLVAVDDAWGMDWFDPAVISRYLPHGMAVTVKDKSDKTLRLAEPVPVEAR